MAFAVPVIPANNGRGVFHEFMKRRAGVQNFPPLVAYNEHQTLKEPHAIVYGWMSGQLAFPSDRDIGVGVHGRSVAASGLNPPFQRDIQENLEQLYHLEDVMKGQMAFVKRHAKRVAVMYQHMALLVRFADLTTQNAREVLFEGPTSSIKDIIQQLDEELIKRACSVEVKGKEGITYVFTDMVRARVLVPEHFHPTLKTRVERAYKVSAKKDRDGDDI